jgi:peroxiredoxin family protein
MQEAAKIASLLSRKEITTVDMYNCMLALKLSRASYNYKEDNYLDLVAYIASLNDYQNNVQNEHSKDKKRKNTK